MPKCVRDPTSFVKTFLSLIVCLNFHMCLTSLIEFAKSEGSYIYPYFEFALSKGSDIYPYFEFAQSEGSDKTAHMQRFI